MQCHVVQGGIGNESVTEEGKDDTEGGIAEGVAEGVPEATAGGDVAARTAKVAVESIPNAADAEVIPQPGAEIEIQEAGTEEVISDGIIGGGVREGFTEEGIEAPRQARRIRASS